MRLNRHAFFIYLISIMFVGCSETENNNSSQAANEDRPETKMVVTESAKAKAIEAKDALFAKLSGRLMEVMQSEGPAKAIGVCSAEARQIAETIGKEKGVVIGRTALKLRNKDNRAPSWAETLLSEEATEPVFVDVNSKTAGALFPIKLKAKCLMCHGAEDSLDADVKAQLVLRYPDDRATGFEEGDLRGWFWVEVPIDP